MNVEMSSLRKDTFISKWSKCSCIDPQLWYNDGFIIALQYNSNRIGTLPTNLARVKGSIIH